MSLITVLGCVVDIFKIFKKEFGFFKAITLIFRSLFRTSKVFKSIHEENPDEAEAKFMKSIALFPAIYMELKDKYDNSIALNVMKEVVIKVSWAYDLQFIKKHKLMDIKDPYNRWLKYRKELSAEGFGIFNKMQDIEVSKTKLQYDVNRCVFHDWFTKAGVPEITHLICDYDKIAHARMFPEYDFGRNGSWKNTIGHGNNCCHYTWSPKAQNVSTPQSE